jgi:hypothetical protein
MDDERAKQYLSEHTYIDSIRTPASFDLDINFDPFTWRDALITAGVLGTIAVLGFSWASWNSSAPEPQPKVITTKLPDGLPKAPWADNPVLPNAHGEVICQVNYTKWKLDCPTVAPVAQQPVISDRNVIHAQEVKRLSAMVTFQTVQSEEVVDTPPPLILQPDGSATLRNDLLPEKSPFLDEKADYQEEHANTSASTKSKKRRSKS